MIVVFGSLNMDLVLRVPAIPRPGETVLCPDYATHAGGKGNNQAIAAAKAGAAVAMAGSVGHDGFGDTLLENLRAHQVDTAGIGRSDRPTGIAMICVDSGGENAIAVASGANLVAGADLVPADRLGADTLVVLQMEVPPEQNWALIRHARAAGARTLLNVAPAAPVPREALDALDVLVVNEIEAEMVAGHLGLGGGGPEATARALADAAGLVCVVTLGGRGALAAEPGNLWQQPAMAIEPVDTTGAGDAFTGVLAAGLDAALELPEALRRAGVGAGLACLALGAQESLPTAAAIDENLARLPPPRRLL